MKSGPRFGAHMSAAGGLENAFHEGVRVGCQSLQLFVKNQRQWNAPPLNQDQIDRFQQARRETGLNPVVAHASYLINLANGDRDKRKRSIHALLDEYSRCARLGVDYLVVHPGAHLELTLEEGIKYIAQSLDELFDRAEEQSCVILLENMAGQGTTIGYRFAHLADIIAQTRAADRLGVCIDTCHLFASGYDFRRREDYDAMMDELQSAIGMASVRCVHTNDSQREAGSRVDRHEHIGKGTIGRQGFAHFVRDPRFDGIPFILETPKGKDGRGADLDKVNLRKLRRLLDQQR